MVLHKFSASEVPEMINETDDRSPTHSDDVDTSSEDEDDDQNWDD